jgi:hypothetical protein
MTFHWAESCTCNWQLSANLDFKIIDSSTEVRCGVCHILLGWWDDDEPARTKKITPFKRDWSWNERIAMR